MADVWILVLSAVCIIAKLVSETLCSATTFIAEDARPVPLAFMVSSVFLIYFRSLAW